MTSWQDFVFTGGSVLFFFSLLPSVFGREKPPLLTSLPTGILLLLFAATYASLGLAISAVMTVPTAILWLVIALQRIVAGRDSRREAAHSPPIGP